MTRKEWRDSHPSKEWRELVQQNRDDMAKMYRNLRSHFPAMGRLLWKRLNAANEKMTDLILNGGLE